jgi:hypothetical protein
LSHPGPQLGFESYFVCCFFILTLASILENADEAIKKGHSRDTGNIRHKIQTGDKQNKKKHNSENQTAFLIASSAFSNMLAKVNIKKQQTK